MSEPESDPILAGDCRLVLPEAFVADVLVVDPPYREHVHKNATSQDQHTDGNVRHNDFGFASLTEELDSERFLRWVNTSEKERVDSVERKFNTERVRKRMADKKLALGDSSGGLSLVPGMKEPLTSTIAGCDHMAGENKELCVICGGFMLPVAATLAQVAAQNPEAIRLAAQLLGVPACPKCDFVMRPGHVCRTKEEIMANYSSEPKAWADAYERCLADLEEAAYGVTEREAIEAGHPYPAHCGSTFCLLRPLQTDECETACGCGCLSCNALSAHLRPPQGGGRADGAGAPEPAVPSVAMVRPPKTPAAERTIPLFDPPFEDEYTAKKWREAYERCLWELAPPLSPTLRARVAERLAATPATVILEPANDPDFVVPPKDDTECGFTNPNGTLIAAKTTGIIPPHVLAELGMHPALVDEPVRNRALVRARHERWSDDWNTLQEKAPTGFFARVLKEMQMAPGERLSVLVEAMRERGLQVSVFDVAGWSPIQRNSARLWVQQNSERPTFFDQYANGEAGILGSCTACERSDKRSYTHTCEKGQGLDKEMEPPKTTWAPTLAPPSEKRGKGRPAGSKNKAPKPWKQAYERVMVELGAS